MVPTGWELPFPSSLFAGGGAGQQPPQQQPQPAGPGEQQQQQQAGGDADPGAAAAAGSWAATAANLPQVMAAFSAAAWNIIGEEQPPRVRLRMWRFDADKPTALLAVLGSEQASGNLCMEVSDAVLCSGGRGCPRQREAACLRCCGGCNWRWDLCYLPVCCPWYQAACPEHAAVAG
jgi:hypothetical protein